MKTLPTVVALHLVAILCTACASTSDANVPNTLLAYVPESEQAEIEEARRRRAEAREASAVAERDAQEVRSLLALARTDLATAERRCEEAIDRAEHAEEFGSKEEFATANERRANAQDTVRLARARVRYYEDLQELAERRRAWLDERVRLADARLQLREAEAVRDLDRPVAKDVDVTEVREAVARFEDTVVREAMEVEVQRTQARLQAEFTADLRDQLPERYRLEAVDGIDDVFWSKLSARGEDPLLRGVRYPRGEGDTGGGDTGGGESGA